MKLSDRTSFFSYWKSKENGLLAYPQEAYGKIWKGLKVGTIDVPAGQHKIYLRAKKIANETVGDVKSLVFRKVEN